MLRAHLPAAVAATVLLGLPATAGAAATATLSAGALTITGDAAPDAIRVTAAGPDAIAADLDGNGSPDASFSAAGVARVEVAGEGGADTITIGDGLGARAIVVDGGPGNDTLTGGDGAERFTWNPGDASDVVDGGAGPDALDFTTSNINEELNLAPSVAVPGAARLTRDVASVTLELTRIDRLSLRLQGGNDKYFGAAGVAALLPLVEVDGGTEADIIAGGDEADVVVGGTGADTLGGGAGNDLFRVDAIDAVEPDAMDGGDGDDRLSVAGTAGRDTFSLSAPSITQVTVQDIRANRAWTATAEGVAIDAGAGDDEVDIPAGLVRVDAWGGEGDDVLNGSNGVDRLDGGPGRDVLRALAGADVLSGGAGDDALVGGAGADAFSCGGLGDVLDATAEDSVAADCKPVVPPVLPPPPGPGTTTVPVPATVPGPPAIVPGTADLRAPGITLRGVPATIKRSALLKSGLNVRVAADEAAALAGELLSTARSARIAAAKPNLTLAAKTLPSAAAGTRTLTLKPSRALVGTAKRFTLTVRVTATDAAGNRRTATKTVKVR